MAQTYGGGSQPRRWQDWANLVLAVWLFISPWVLSFAIGGMAVDTGGAPATGAMVAYAAWDAWVIGVVTAIVALWAMSQFARWQEWVGLVLGIWLFIAPWVLRFAGARNPAWDHWIIGLLVFLVSLSALSYRRAPAATASYAGEKPRDPI
jgi:hypothetical protein